MLYSSEEADWKSAWMFVLLGVQNLVFFKWGSLKSCLKVWVISSAESSFSFPEKWDTK